MEIIDGKKIQEEILNKVKKQVALLKFKPVFTDVLVGKDPASIQYMRMKERMAEKVGMHFHNASFPANISTAELIEEIKKLNVLPEMCGIIVQLPLPSGIEKRIVLDSIDPELDVDCLGLVASTEFNENKREVGFPAALACMYILDSLQLDLKGKNIVVLGQGELVGKPVSTLLQQRGLHPNNIAKSTENQAEILKEADVVISGIGQGKFITGAMLKEGVVIIDAGTSESSGGIVGDVDLESVKNTASYISPVPGGVGPVTVAMLLQNVLKVAQKMK